MTSIDLTTEQRARYARHIILPEVGARGQKKLLSTSVLCIGAGGLGSPILMYLAAAGIGRIGLVEFDVVDVTNLQRQIIHRNADIGRLKSESARDTVLGIHPDCDFVIHSERFSSANAMEIARDYDIIVDGTDNFPTRYLTNDVCVLLGKPNVYGAIFRFEGQVTVFGPRLGGPCYRCLYPAPPPAGSVPSCAEGGVLGVLPGIVGCLQANEVIKLALGAGESLVNRLLLVDAWGMKFRELKLRRDPECPICGDEPTIQELIDYEGFCGVPSAGAPENENEAMKHPDEVTVHELKDVLKDPESEIRVIDVRERDEWEIASIQGATLTPLSELPERVAEFDMNATYYIHCKKGGRSMKALELLRSHGFSRLKSVRGGIDAWREEIDPDLPAY